MRVIPARIAEGRNKKAVEAVETGEDAEDAAVEAGGNCLPY
jgi:hypothetical protein